MSSGNGNNESGKSSGSAGTGGASQGVSWGTKAGYVGTGVMIGLIIYPFVRKAVARFQPRMDEFFDNLTGKAEGLAEKASDFMARAKENLAGEKNHDHEHAEKHDPAHEHSKEKRKSSTIQ